MRVSAGILSCAAGLLAAGSFAAELRGQNDRRKIRARPSALAAKAGTGVPWRDDVAAALAASRKSGKPVFWYVPTLAGSPMDRKPEIDRYMMAGPFSWPRMIALLAAEFVPVRAPAGGELARKYRLRRGAFIEPGYLVLDGAGKELLRKDQLTTFHPDWMLAPLAAAVGRPVPAPAPPSAAQRKLVAGMRLFAAGRSDAAIALWAKLAAEHPDDPAGWKAAAEAEGHGPFRFGFEVFEALPAAVLDGVAAAGSGAPDGAYQEPELRARSTAFLCRMQLANGGWEDSRYDFGGTDSLPNVYVACTALIAHALLEELHAAPPAGDTKAIAKALARAIPYLIDSERINLADTDEQIWAHVYRVHFFCRYLELHAADAAKCAPIRNALRGAVGQVYAMQPGSGCWFHEYPNPFVCAEVLVALHRANAFAEIPFDDRKIDRGVKALLRCRAKSGAFSYGFGGGSGVEAAAGRMPLCELALLLFGSSQPEHLDRAVDASFRHHDLLGAVRRYDDHADRHGYGGFFFWFDMLGRTRALSAIADADQRSAARARQRELITTKLPEIDGCFVDSHELGRTYGTAMALLCLARLR